MEGISVQETLFLFLGGLGIFLFGIKYMGDGLEKAAGDRLRLILDRLTTNPVMGVIAGILTTVLIQSSSATTVLVVGFVNAGLMTLRQAIGVIMGANIGTTVTAFIIGLKIEDYALPIIALGAILLFFLKSEYMRNIGQIIFGFGMLFYGLQTMGTGLKPLKDLSLFQDLMVELGQNPILGVLVGTVFTVIVQSSSATIGVLQQLADDGGVALRTALPILFGDNIGTTITAVLASLGASLAARRAALSHVLFNVIGTIIFILALPLFYPLVTWLGEMTGADIRMQIAYAHGIFNFTNTLIQLPFIGVLAYIVTKVIRGEEEIIEYGAKNLDTRLLNNPSVALGQAAKELDRMAHLSFKALNNAADYFFHGKSRDSELVMQREEVINDLEKKISDYLTQISSSTFSAAESNRHTLLMQTINDIERVGDHATNVVELGNYKKRHKIVFSDEAFAELQEMYALTLDTFGMAIEALKQNDTELAQKVIQNEEKIDKMERKFRKSHIARLNNGHCTGNAGVAFLDFISNLERIGDHSMNIAQSVLGEY